MKTFIPYLLLLFPLLQVGCKTNKSGFIKSTKEYDVTLVRIVEPYINFVLESKDTIRFSRQDIVNIIDERHAKEIKRIGYLSSRYLTDLRESLSGLKTDTTVSQKLSAVGTLSISDNLDGWIARELLLDGKGIVALAGDYKSINKLKYVYLKDLLGGEQCSFYTTDKRLVYRTIISLGE